MSVTRMRTPYRTANRVVLTMILKQWELRAKIIVDSNNGDVVVRVRPWAFFLAKQAIHGVFGKEDSISCHSSVVFNPRIEVRGTLSFFECVFDRIQIIEGDLSGHYGVITRISRKPTGERN